MEPASHELNHDGTCASEPSVTQAANLDSPDVVRLAQDYRASLEAGQTPNRQELLKRFPGIADELGACLDALEFVHQVAPQLQNGEPSGPERSDAIQPVALGDFRIIRQIGRGGMGVVYEAEQLSLGRRIALKVLPFSGLADERQLQRFRNEARAAATLHHPHIVPVFSVGSERGVYYYAMQYIDGPSLADVLGGLRRFRAPATLRVQPQESNQRRDAGRVGDVLDAFHPNIAASSDDASQPSETHRDLQAALSTQRSTSPGEYFRIVARWGIEAAQALGYAHQQGVLHRDIKPANLLLDRGGNLWITDFGLARLENDVSVTMSGDIVGTLRYMAPEQALGKRAVVDQRADIYGLGVTLYELLTLQPAFQGDDRESLLQQITQDDPTAVRKIDHAIPVDLETIVMKAVARAAEDRYATAEDLADDLKQFLSYKSIRAKPPTTLDRVRKWTRRHQAATWSAVLVLLVLSVLSSAGFLWSRHMNAQLVAATEETQRNNRATLVALAEEAQAKRDAQQARDQAEQTRQEAVNNLYLAKMRQAYHDVQSGNTTRVHRVLGQFIPGVIAGQKADLRGWEWYYLLGQCHTEVTTLRGRMGTCSDVAWQPAGNRLATVDGGTVTIWNASDWTREATFGHGVDVTAISWHPEGKLLATACGNENSIRIWDLDSGRIVRKVTADNCRKVAFSPDGSRLAAALEGWGWKVWNTGDSEQVGSLQQEDDSWARAVAWHPSGKLLACGAGNDNSSVRVWDVDANQETVRITGMHDLFCLSWSPRGDLIATGDYHHAVHVFNADTGEPAHIFKASSSVHSICWSPDQQWIASVARPQTVVWNLTSGSSGDRLLGHVTNAVSVGWHPQGRFVVSGAEDGTVRVWNVDQVGQAMKAAGIDHAEPAAESPKSTDARFLSPSGTSVAIPLIESKEMLIVDRATQQVVQRFSYAPLSEVQSATWSPDGQALACNHATGEVVVWSLDGGQQQRWEVPTGGRVRSLDWNPKTGHHLAAAISLDNKQPLPDEQDGVVVVWDTRSGDQSVSISADQGSIQAARWSPDGSRLATSGWTGTVKIWNARNGELLNTLEEHTSRRWVASLAWSPDGSLLATGGWDRSICVWQVAEARLISTLVGHTSMVGPICWTKDGRRLLSSSGDRTIRVWEPFMAEEILQLPGGGARALFFDRDGQRLYAVHEHDVHVLDTTGAVTYDTNGDLLYDLVDVVSGGERPQGQTLRLLEAAWSQRTAHPSLAMPLLKVYTRLAKDQATRAQSLDEIACQSLVRAVEAWKQAVGEETGRTPARYGIPQEELIARYMIYQVAGAVSWSAEKTGSSSEAALTLFENLALSLEDRLRSSPSLQPLARRTALLGLATTELSLCRVIGTDQGMPHLADTYARSLNILRQLIASEDEYSVAEVLEFEDQRDAVGLVERDKIRLRTELARFQTRSLLPPVSNYDEAFRSAAELLELAPDDPVSWCEYGWACYRLGRHDEARRWLEKFVDSNHFAGSELAIAALTGASLTHVALGNADTARQYYDCAIELVRGKMPLDALDRVVLSEAANALTLDFSLK